MKPHPKKNLKEHQFGNPRARGGKQAHGQFADSDPNQREPLPPATGKPPYRLALTDVIKNELSATKMVFHVAGDTGGISNGTPQLHVAQKMIDQLEDAMEDDKPSFFYHVGDVVYFNGEWANYYQQFFKPYENYLAPIFAIPGNHDGSVNPTDANSGIKTFVEIFCDDSPKKLDISQDVNRSTMTQPNVYWTLQTPLANIIGLYTNVSESQGYVDADQKAWFIGELKNAQKERSKKALIVALHHPVYSVDREHGESTEMQKLLNDVFDSADAGTKGIIPDLILTGHVHNYQRFTRTYIGGQQVPFLVVGSGGYYHHSYVDSKNAPVSTPNTAVYGNSIRFEAYSEDYWGFLRITIDAGSNQRLMTCEYFTAPLPSEPLTGPAVRFDNFQIDLTTNKVKNLPN